MIAAWILYALVVGVLVGGGALVLERMLRAHRRPVRWVWVGAMVLSIAWPLAHLLLKTFSRISLEEIPPLPARPIALETLAVQVRPESFLRVLDTPIVLGWTVASLLLMSVFLLLLRRTRRLRAGWRGEEAGGRKVLISEDWGPAVVGFTDPQIVLPSWCRELDEETLRLILDHEFEHLNAGDLRLLLLAGLLPMLLPWSIPLWWQMSRLRVAVEGDCDLRVLRRHPHRVRPYLELLLEVGRRLPRGQALAAMLSEPEETLERRIRIMTMPFPKNPWARGVLLTGVGSVLVALACWAPGPTDAREEEEASPDAAAVVLPPEVAKLDLAAGPTFTPFTVRPDIRNRAEISRSLEREYPPLLRDAGIGGTTQVWFFIDATGTVQRTLVNETSGHKALDDAALRVAEAIEFTPAYNRDEAVPVWVSLPITFTVRGDKEAEASARPTDAAGERSGALREKPGSASAPAIALPTFREVEAEREAEGAAHPELAATPTFTPFTVRPDIRNRDEVSRALEREYPPLLRDAGIGGSIQVWFFIDETGRVQRTLVNESSGHQALDEAALRVAGMIEFTPARNRDEPVPVWISLPISFTTR